MATLGLTQSDVGPERYRVEVAFEGDGQPRQIATTEFEFSFKPQDREGLRWYLEDYLEHAADPASQIAARIERRMAEIGTDIFKALFHSSDDARDLWATLRQELNCTRVEVISGVKEATALPWELLRDPVTDVPLALRADAFVRAAHQAAQRPRLPQSSDGPIRILLVICRPGGRQDVPFRSVASRLIKSLSESAREAFQLDVLRPPTFEQLSTVLRTAKADGKPYHVVHFDGHGAYIDTPKSGGTANLLAKLSRIMLSAPRAGSHGYLVFENSALADNHQLVDGPSLGKLLVETQVPVLVLNACRSAHAEPPPEPEEVASAPAGGDGDFHAKVRAFGSLAQEVIDAGVVAMRYNVYVITAAQFVANLYKSLANGQALGEAVTVGRKQLDAQPLREIAYTPRPLQDWMVPIVYEAAPVTLFPKPAKASELNFTIDAAATAATAKGIAPALEISPDIGFFGRDETLLALDRAFDTQRVVLLHAFAGSGKSSTAAEFARWYHLTGGIDGPVLFTSFGRKTTLAQALNESIGKVFSALFEANRIPWLALPDDARRDVALKALARFPMLWVWDNVEPIAGFPAGTQSAWSADEQGALAGFLRAARDTKAKFLLTSRRDERAWLGDLPARIEIPPMPMQERVQLARELAKKHGRSLADVDAWIPLLRFTAGNPLTITVLVGQALRDGLATTEQIEAFVLKLRAGEATFEDEEIEGRSKSLGASLNYGFENAFTDDERRQLALLHFFQGYVTHKELVMMGDPASEWSVPAIRSLTPQAAIQLLDRAAEVGLLTAFGNGLYAIHPALPWFFKQLFDHFYAQQAAPSAGSDPRQIATRAYIASESWVSRSLQVSFSKGRRGGVMALQGQEANLLNALHLARSHGVLDAIIDLMGGLRNLYSYQGRALEWKKMVDDIFPQLIDPQTNLAKLGFEDSWTRVMGWKGDIAMASGDYDSAQAIFSSKLEFARLATGNIQDRPADSWTELEKSRLYTFANAMFDLGKFQGKALDPATFAILKVAFDLFEKLDAHESAASCAFHLGHAYMDIGKQRDLTEADSWYCKSIELGDKTNPLKYAGRLHERGQVRYVQMVQLLQTKEPDIAEVEKLANSAAAFAREALAILPEDAMQERMLLYHLLGNLYDDTGHVKEALVNYQEAVRCTEDRSAFGEGAMFCREIARCLRKAGRLDEALLYARESLQKLTNLGPGAKDDILRSNQLIQAIEQDLRAASNQIKST